MKILTAENHKYCEKIRKNRQKKRQKSDKLSLFQSTLVVFCRCLKSDKKCDKSDKLSLFRFVGAHPSLETQTDFNRSQEIRGASALESVYVQSIQYFHR